MTPDPALPSAFGCLACTAAEARVIEARKAQAAAERMTARVLALADQIQRRNDELRRAQELHEEIAARGRPTLWAQEVEG